MKPPKVRGPLSPRTVDGETIWVSADQAWTVVPRAVMERQLGRALHGGDGDTVDDLGLVLGTGPDAPGRSVVEMGETTDDVVSSTGAHEAPTPRDHDPLRDALRALPDAESVTSILDVPLVASQKLPLSVSGREPAHRFITSSVSLIAAS